MLMGSCEYCEITWAWVGPPEVETARCPRCVGELDDVPLEAEYASESHNASAILPDIRVAGYPIMSAPTVRLRAPESEAPTDAYVLVMPDWGGA